MRGPALVLVLVLAGCGDGGGDGPDSADEPDAGSIDPDAPPGCSRPVDPPPWLPGLIDDAVARLAGARPILPGVTLSNRSSPTNRESTRQWLADQLESYGYAALSDPYGTGENVYAELASTTGGAGWIVVGAHFDTVSVSPGANDNATGVAITLAVARQLRAMTCRQHGVKLVLFDQEEVGVLGSASFADMLVADGTSVTAVHTIDQVGWDSDGDRRFELELPTAALRTAYRATAMRIGASTIDTDTAASDHHAFRLRGFAAIGITEEFVTGDTTPHYHTAGDTFATVDLAYTELGARLVGETVMDQLEP